MTQVDVIALILETVDEPVPIKGGLKGDMEVRTIGR
jgi:hypothetical protein